MRSLIIAFLTSFLVVPASAGTNDFLMQMGEKGEVVCHILAAPTERQATAVIAMLALAGQIEHDELDLAWKVWLQQSGSCDPNS